MDSSIYNIVKIILLKRKMEIKKSGDFPAKMACEWW